MKYLFTSESVSEGHPDKIADQISDAIVDNYLAFDPESHCGIEVCDTTGQVILMGEVKSKANIDLATIARNTINNIGYNKSEYKFDGDSCGILNAIHEQSSDIDQGVSKVDLDEQGAGDQGIIFGYAVNETSNYMPLTIDLAHLIVSTLAEIRKKHNIMTYLRPDAKCQVTVEYNDDKTPQRIDTIVLSTQHDDFASDDAMLDTIRHDVINILIPLVKQKCDTQVRKLFNNDIKYLINPTGKFVIGGPNGDSGVTGRKLIIDTYGGRACHGGGNMSGKDPSKVDRSAAYMTRYIAKNMVAAGVADEMLIQVSYAIGVADPVSVFVNTFNRCNVGKTDGELAEYIRKTFNLRPRAIENILKLRQPMYLETAAYGHMGRKNEVVKKTFTDHNGNIVETDVELFTWERLDLVDKIRKDFSLDK